jgi:hypothetical protein
MFHPLVVLAAPLSVAVADFGVGLARLFGDRRRTGLRRIRANIRLGLLDNIVFAEVRSGGV